ncbi:MAG: MBL fold metallo-hydrolase [Verrucomicrobia bacterium]|nr:MBL fold metallo-hydrolase [Verrucomicrobiota bacterium]
MKLSFLGAAQNVTGSCYLLEQGNRRIVIDCGMFQERDFRGRNWEPFPVAPNSIDTVLLTHAHLDHCGLLPKLVKEGFKGKILGTPASLEIAQIIMLDSGKIQQEDAAFKKKRHEREDRKGPHPVEALYTVEDAEAVPPLFSPVEYVKPIDLGDGLSASFHESGHILGATSIRLEFGTNGTRKSILFSGDVGRWDSPIIRDPNPDTGADYVVTESTYGNRVHAPTADIPEKLADIINSTRERGGNVVVPSFAVERTQELLFHMTLLRQAKKIPHLMVFVDSPMAIRVTEVFRKHPELFDEEARELLRQGRHPCDFPGLTMTRSANESKAINQIKGTAVIIAGSGMCTGGRIKHHLANNISREESTIMFVGYQAVGTLGRIILEKQHEEIRIHGQMYPLRARIEKINGFSAHGDKNELFRWISSLNKVPQRVFVTHGEVEAAEDYAQLLRDKLKCEVTVPEYKQDVVLD